MAAAIAGVLVLDNRGPHEAPFCRVTTGSAGYLLDQEQARYATTIAAIGKSRGLPDHAVTVALAAALQESGLHDLGSGDRDSVGLFQQRPSQGWGSKPELLNPVYAASAFYQHLALVTGWETLPVTEAAQLVQHSATPDAYAVWEAEARALAEALTGEVPAAFSCSIPPTSPPPGAATALATAMSDELGSATLGTPLPAARGWTVASWLVGHAAEFGLSQVDFAGRRWTAGQDGWVAARSRSANVTFRWNLRR